MFASWKKTFLTKDYQSLSLFRILLALYIGADFFTNMLPYYIEWFTDSGLYPRPALLTGYSGVDVLSLLVMSDYWPFHLALIYIHILSIVAFAIGYKTRWANLALFVTYTSFYWRNPLLGSGSETICRLLLLWSLFLPMARYWSVNAALDPEPRDRAYPTTPFVAIKLQIVILYLFSAFYKFASAAWWNGSAVGVVLSDNVWGGTATGLYMLHNFGAILPPVTYATMFFQFFFSPLVYFPKYNNWTRGFALLGAAAMHLSFLLMLNIGWFPYICVIYLVLLVPDRWWNALLAKRRTRLGHIRIFYDPDCGFCRKTALLLREFCLSPTVAVLPADDDQWALTLLRENNSWVVYDVDGAPLLRWRAVAYVLRQNPLLWIFGVITDLRLLRPAMERVYHWIGARRPLWGKWTEKLLPYRVQPAVGPAAIMFCGFLSVAAVLFCVMDIRKPEVPLPWFEKDVKNYTIPTPGELIELAAFFQVSQFWNVFAPNPLGLQTRYAMTGDQADGRTVDLRDLWPKPLFWLEPDNYRVSFLNLRWQKYFYRLQDDTKGDNERQALAKYLCLRANMKMKPSSQYVRAVHLQFFQQEPDTPWRDDNKAGLQVDHTCEPIKRDGSRTENSEGG